MSEEAGAASELLELLYICPFGVAKIDGLGNIKLMNPVAAQLLIPLDPAGDLSNFFDIFKRSAPELYEMARRFQPRAGRICDEYRVMAGIGTGKASRTAVLSLTLHKVDEDTICAAIADVTSSAQREQLLRLNEARLHAVFDGVRDYGICTVERAGRVTSWNKSAEALDGYRPDEITGAAGDVLFPSAGTTAHTFGRILESALKAGWYEYEGWRVRKNGTQYWANSVFSVLRDKDDQHLGFSIITRDMTERKRTEDQLLLLATTDPLTGALNRRGLFEAAIREEERRKRTNGTTCLVMLDIDHFKHVNDVHGHPSGDIVLRRVVEIVRAELRAIDIIGRYGGEEFALLLPGSTLANARAVAERIRTRVEGDRLDIDGVPVSVTVSAGVAAMTAEMGDISNLVHAADSALYEAKRDGRNRVASA